MVRQFLFDLLVAQVKVAVRGKYTLLVNPSISGWFLHRSGNV